jgi:hypothetical protein
VPLAYALQISAIAFGLSVLGLSAAFIASRIYDRNTRRFDEAERSHKADRLSSTCVDVSAVRGFLTPSPSHPSATHAPAAASPGGAV